MEEGFWKQKAKVKWLRDRDRNSKYFHAVVTKKRCKATRKANGDWVDSEAQICNEAVSFFEELFTAESCPLSYELLNVIPNLTTDQDNLRLMEVLSLQELKTIVFSMDEESAAVLMVLPVNFLPLHWRLLPRMYIEQYLIFPVVQSYQEVLLLRQLF